MSVAGTSDKRPVVLVMCDYYLPGFKAGGPIQSLSRVVERLSSRFRFKVVTTDRDLGDEKPFAGVARGTWQQHGAAEVSYVSPASAALDVPRLLVMTPHDALYLNSLFSRSFSMVPLLARRMYRRRAPVLLAPRGELSEGALAIRPGRKRAYLRVARTLGVFRDPVWQATSAAEADDIRRWFGSKPIIHTIPNFGPACDGAVRALEKIPGRLSVLALGRVAPLKNLHVALEALREVQGTIELSIVGPIDDEAYWARCQDQLRLLPPNIVARYLGAVPQQQVAQLIDDHHVLFSPTGGENYGHAIAEALARGRPAVISNRTPWRGLREAGAGWELEPDDVAGYRAALQELVRTNDEAYQAAVMATRAYASARLEESESVARFIDVLTQLTATSPENLRHRRRGGVS